MSQRPLRADWCPGCWRLRLIAYHHRCLDCAREVSRKAARLRRERYGPNRFTPHEGRCAACAKPDVWLVRHNRCLPCARQRDRDAKRRCPNKRKHAPAGAEHSLAGAFPATDVAAR
jgi:hypothetical protein